MSDDNQTGSNWLEAVEIGACTSFHKTITDADITLYAGLSGDLHRIHLDDEYARQTPFGRRLAHGAMLVGFMSACGTMLVERFNQRTSAPNVSVGYDRIRFIAPAMVGRHNHHDFLRRPCRSRKAPGLYRRPLHKPDRRAHRDCYRNRAIPLIPFRNRYLSRH